jgi:hypothetical protein
MFHCDVAHVSLGICSCFIVMLHYLYNEHVYRPPMPYATTALFALKLLKKFQANYRVGLHPSSKNMY